jgi:alpha-2-macroglobulin
MNFLKSRFNAGTGLGVALAVLVGGCTSSPAPSTDSNAAASSTSTIANLPTTEVPSSTLASDVVVATASNGPAPRLFNVSLSEGIVPSLSAVNAIVTQGDELNPTRVAELVSKLPKWDDPSLLATPFNWPTQSSPPPRVGATVNEVFPPTSKADAPSIDSGPLKVLRVQPDGNVPIAPYLAVTFNQPMVPIGTVTQLAPADAPVKLTPNVPGRWQWIGTRILRFDAEASAKVDRLPMATTFTATVPAGTKSATGKVLGTDATFTFATPAPVVESFFPTEENVALEPVFVATFDQRINVDAVLGTITLNAGAISVAVRVATAAEIAADERAKNVVANAKEGRWIAFRPVSALPKATSFSVKIGPGTPSAEGPLTTTEAKVFRGSTYGPLEVRRVYCTSGDECLPGTGFNVEFSNPLDPKAPGTKSAVVSVNPKLAAQAITANYGVTIEGSGQARTTYKIMLPASLTDVFGQTLDSDVEKTVTVGAARPSLRPLDIITTVDPFAKSQKLSVLSTNEKELRVRVFEADPAKFSQYTDYLEKRDSQETELPLPSWKVLSDTKIAPKDDNDATVETSIDLGPALAGKPGQVIVFVEALPVPPRSSDRYWESRPTISWVQSTSMALDSFADAKEMRLWATDLRTGGPLSGVGLSASNGGSATTNESGQAVLPLLAGQVTQFVRASRGAESFILPVSAEVSVSGSSVRWYAFDDRQIYRPGETISVKGWNRLIDEDTRALTKSGITKMAYVIRDSNGVDIATGTADVGSLGGFHFTASIPKTANVGSAQIEFSTAGGNSQNSGQHAFQIEEFRRPEFEVKVDPVTTEPFVSTGPVTMSTTASYFAGGPLPNAPVEWSVSTGETTFSPVGWDAFTFGIFRPWWWAVDFEGSSDFVGRRSTGPAFNQVVKAYSGTTDASGRHALQLDFKGDDGGLPDLPVSVTVSGTVTDVNRQAWADTRNIIVHSADRYVGLRSDRSFVKQGDPMNIEAIATDADGKAQGGTKLTITAGLLRSNYVDGKLVEEVVDAENCVVTSAAAPVKCEFNTLVGGQYRVTSTITDAKGGRNRSELSVWVSGATSQPTRNVEQEELTLVPDKKEYAAGDTAKLLVQAPFVKGEGLVLVTHGNGVRETKRFSAADGSAEISVSVAESDVPGLGVTVEVVGAAERIGFDGKKVNGAPPRPAYAVGTLNLSVPPVARTLKVTAKPAVAELEPGGKTTVAVTVNDAAGAPVKDAEFAVVVVDEAVLGLSDYKLVNPIEFFYDRSFDSLRSLFGRDQVRLVDPETLATQPTTGEPRLRKNAQAATTAAPAAAEASFATDGAAAPGAGRSKAKVALADKANGASAGTISVRSNFDALALFAPTVVTDASGKANVDVTLPDNLTRYRIMVVAASGVERFGTAESNITARLPLSVRPSAPRFLNTGDQFELPVVLQNLGKSPLAVDVVLQTANLDTTGATGRKVSIPAGDRVEIRFPAKVRLAGVARIRVSAFGDNVSDSAEVSIPVFTPGTAEAFATYGTIDSGGVKQPLLAPKGVIDSYGGLEVSTSSTSLQALTDALLYVDEYDYQSSDAYASRIISISALRDVLKDFAAKDLPSEADFNAAVDRDIAGLIALQNDDGGWSYWRKYDESEPFGSVEAAHALILAKKSGFTVSANAIERALQYLNNIEQVLQSRNYSEESRDRIQAYALWVRALAGQRDPGKAATLFASRGEKLNLDALAWLWGSIDSPQSKAAIERTITNRAVDTAGAVSFTNSYTDSDYLTLSSDRRTDALVLDSLIANVPKSDLVEKVVAGLLAHKVKGRWNNVQENTFALLAFKRYYDTYESATPNFVARAWVGDQFAGEHVFKGRTTERSNISVPMKAIVEGGNRDLIVVKDGTGRLYYRIGLKYVPADLKLKALDRGFVVDRIYEGVDNKSDVTRDADGTWKIKAGAKVRIKLTLVAESQRTHVALIDPLPAGLEALNTDLAVTQPVVDSPQAEPTKRFWWWGNWYDFQQFRDDRSEAFTTFLAAGVYDYSYIARATTPGSFVVPPTRAEEMYAPETFGRTSTDNVVITAP